MAPPKRMKKKVPSSDELADMAEELQEKPREKANFVPILISHINSRDYQVRSMYILHISHAACALISALPMSPPLCSGAAHHPGP